MAHSKESAKTLRQWSNRCRDHPPIPALSRARGGRFSGSYQRIARGGEYPRVSVDMNFFALSCLRGREGMAPQCAQRPKAVPARASARRSDGCASATLRDVGHPPSEPSPTIPDSPRFSRSPAPKLPLPTISRPATVRPRILKNFSQVPEANGREARLPGETTCLADLKLDGAACCCSACWPARSRVVIQ